MMIKRLLFLFIALMILGSCFERVNTFSKIPPGPWRAVLKLDNKQVTLAQEVKEVEYKKSQDYAGELPFQFEVVYDDLEDFHINIINGSEKIKVDDIRFGRDRRTGKDTVEIHFPVYDSYIKALYEEGILEGNWFVNYKDAYAIPFIARHGKGHRFTDLGKQAEVDFTGNWAVEFAEETEDAYPAIGEFKQKGNNIEGSFLTETGDYRFLAGNVIKDKLYLSCFDGAHAFLFEAKQQKDGSLSGIFRSGSHYSSSWIATKKEGAAMTNPFELTQAQGDKKLAFSFKNTEGKMISLDDKQYAGKSKLVMIMGTWCPNCRDEMNFLQDYFENNPTDKIALVAVGFERYKEEAKAIATLKRYKEKMEIPFEVLYGGYFSKKLATEQFPMLDKIISYPTLLFVDADNNITKVHTGFSGPATSKFPAFKKEFDALIKDMLKK